MPALWCLAATCFLSALLFAEQSKRKALLFKQLQQSDQSVQFSQCMAIFAWLMSLCIG